MGSFTKPPRAEERDSAQDLAQALARTLAQAMAERIGAAKSHAEALRELRSAFPDSPLTVRVAALAMMRKLAGTPNLSHIPR
jgi:hypothetical protein